MKLFRQLLLPTLALLAAIASSQPSASLSSEKKAQVIDMVTSVITRYAYVPGVDFGKVKDYIADLKPEIDKASTDDDFADAMNKAFMKFGFSHLVLHSPRLVEARQTNQMVGIGVRINVQPDGILVIALIDGAPAQAAGIEPGDLIVEADGKKVTGPGQVQGPEGTKVHIKVKKADGKFREMDVVRRKFSTVRQEELSWVDKETAWLRIYTFDLSYSRERVEQLMKDAAKAKRLIIDLRGNGGGAVLNLMHLMGLTMSTGSSVGTFVSKQIVDAFVKEKGGDPTDLKAIAKWSPQIMRVLEAKQGAYKGDIAVLVDGGSGSAAEIAAIALKENRNATVVGQKSAGMVLVSFIRPLADTGYAIQFPMSDYVSAKGVRLEGNGVKPDLETPRSPAFIKKGEKDPTVVAALDFMKKSASVHR